jgi:hypothetical protein
MRFFETKSEVIEETESVMQALWRRAYPNRAPELPMRALETVRKAFNGNHPDYEAIDAPYHDLEHTLRASLCCMQLVEKNIHCPAFISLTPEMAELAWIAILFHDTGYLKDQGDKEGSGAKHSFVHVSRSQIFAAKWMSQQGLNETSIQRVNSMILCTEYHPQRPAIHFDSEEHRLAGCMVGTADWLAQMAAPDYLLKLPFLHQEMLEARNASPDTPHPMFIPDTDTELLESTPRFFDQLVKPKLEQEFEGVFHLLSDPFPNGPNPYLDRILKHLENINQNSRLMSKG